MKLKQAEVQMNVVQTLRKNYPEFGEQEIAAVITVCAFLSNDPDGAYTNLADEGITMDFNDVADICNYMEKASCE